MSSKTSRAMIFRIVCYLSGILFILAVAQVQKQLGANLLEPQVSSLSAANQAQLDALYDLDNLVTTLATALLGGLGFFLVNGRKIRRWSAAMWLAVASAGCAALSLFLGYVLYLALLDMLKNEMFDPDMATIMWVRVAQFYSFLLAVVLFGDFAFQTLNAEDGREHKRVPAGD